jgi:hypothetical protein
MHRYLAAKGKRRAEFRLTPEEYFLLITMPCIYGGGLPVPNTGVGLDQIVAGAGYTPENSVPCCYRHNHMKGKFLSYEDMMFLMKHGRPELRACDYSSKVVPIPSFEPPQETK